ncbi:CPBP family intramembrane glutamic endopeptidase [Lentilactobacillus hilgardii]|uniref:CPBP family intramembrane glutamic endopeptidase n=1 Tax=Lentilactobacillus hilgardii TaxID=1588 RepID=UPI00390C60B6
MRKQWSLKTVYGNYLIFWLIWLVVQGYLKGIQTQYTTGMANDLINVVVKAVIWISLGLFWFSRTQNQLWLSKKKLYNSRFPIEFWLALVIFIGYLFMSMWIRHHGFYITTHPFTKEGGNFLSVTLAAGLIEELVFRGFFCNFLLTKYDMLTAIMIQALLFQAIHFPIYWAEGLSLMGWVANVATVLPLGIVFGWIFYRSRNLWPSTILHCVWDTAILLFV